MFLVYTNYAFYVLRKLIRHFDVQVSVLDVEAYQVPEGNQLKEGSRKSRRREMYTPRAQQRQQNKAAAPVPV